MRSAVNPEAERGFLNLSSYNLSSHGTVNINGEWEFYWRQLLYPDDFSGGKNITVQYAEVPSTWHDLSLKGHDTGPKGFATYRVKIKVPDKSRVYGLHVFSLMSAYRIWADGVLIAEAGHVGVSDETMEHRWVPGEYYFKPLSDTVELIVQISNFRCDLGGFWTPVGFGFAGDIASWRRIKIAYDSFLMGILLILAFYHIGFFIFQRKEMSTLWFGLFCVIMIVRILSLGEQRILYQLFGSFWDISYRIELLSFYIAGGVFYFFLSSIYREESSPPVRKFTAAMILCTVSLAVFLPTFQFGHIIIFYIILTFFYISAGVYVIARAVFKRREGAVTFMVGIIALLIPALNDVMNLLGFLHGGFYVPVGFMVFVLTQSLVMLRRFSMSFVKNENLTAELELVNITLEQKVEERTRALEVESDILRNQGMVMDEELTMARSIQRGLIPVKSPLDNISFYYRPMKRVGGDFFDFIYMREDSVGILISDVSGHGVPAALITSMLKSFVLQSGEKKQNPEEFMAYLNDSLIDHTSGNFITAFYCIYNPGERNLVYCNAGHPLPFIISESGVTSVSSENRMLPMAILKSEELEKLDKKYRNSICRLNPGDRLFLFTDGLIEARDGRFSKDMFGDDELEVTLYNNRNLPVGEFLGAISRRLLEYCRSENFEDDICMICVDI